MSHSPDNKKTYLALAVSEGYFLQNKSQKQLAKELEISAATVSRLLQFAVAEGLVQIRIHPPKNIELGQDILQLCEAFGLREVVVTPPGRQMVGQAAARFFENESQDEDTIVLDGGLTVRDFVNAIAPRARRQLFVSHIATDPPSYEASSYENMTRLAVACPQSTCVKLPYAKSDYLDTIAEEARRVARNADFVILGVGPVMPKFTGGELMVHFGLDIADLRKSYPQVSGISGYLTFDGAGQEASIAPLEEIVRRALNIDELRELSRSTSRWVCLLASSAAKTEPTLAALRAMMFNCLILDQELAIELRRCLREAT